MDTVTGNINDAKIMNRLAYANGNPINMVDPFGTSALSDAVQQFIDNTNNLMQCLDLAMGIGSLVTVLDPSLVGVMAPIMEAYMLTDIIIDSMFSVLEALIGNYKKALTFGVAGLLNVGLYNFSSFGSIEGNPNELLPINYKAGPKIPKVPVEGAGEAADSTPKTLYHYTNEEGLNGILDSNELRPSLKANNPKDARYGDGQYLSDIIPETTKSTSLSSKFIRVPNKYKYTHFVEIDVTGLEVVEGRSGVYVIPNEGTLDITGRIVRSGEVGK